MLAEISAPPRARRIENEWLLLINLIGANHEILGEARRGEDEFEVVLRETVSPVIKAKSICLEASHAVRLVFPRFFPTMPVEAYLRQPVFHPNIHPLSGFVCLWSEWSVQQTVADALVQLQGMLTYRRWNETADHVMQPAAFAWEGVSLQRPEFPLPCKFLARPEGLIAAGRPGRAPSRQRLNKEQP